MEPPTPEAPPAIAVVRDFVNTTDRETGTDDLSTPADLTLGIKSLKVIGRHGHPCSIRVHTQDWCPALSRPGPSVHDAIS